MKNLLLKLLLPISVRKENKRLKNLQLDHQDEVFALKLQLERAVKVADDAENKREYWRGEAMLLLSDIEEIKTTLIKRNKLLQMQSEEIDGLTQDLSMQEHSLTKYERDIAELTNELSDAIFVADEQRTIALSLESERDALEIAYAEAINDVDTLLQDTTELTAELEIATSLLEESQLEESYLSDELQSKESQLAELTSVIYSRN